MHVGVQVKYSYSCQILMKLEFPWQIVEKSWDIECHQNSYSGRRIVSCIQAGITQLMVAFRKFSNAPKRRFLHFKWSITDVWQLLLFCVFNIRGFWFRRFGIVPPCVIAFAVSSRQLWTLWNMSLTRQFSSCRLMFRSSVFRGMSVKNTELLARLWSQS